MKVCIKCGLEKQLEMFTPDKKNKVDGKSGMCRECKNERARLWYTLRNPKTTEANCIVCKQTKQIEKFRSTDGINSNLYQTCSDCREKKIEKYCSKCKQIKQINEFPVIKGQPYAYCKECKKEFFKETIRNREIKMEGTKVCNKCNETKDIKEFGVKRIRPDGRENYCQVCARKKTRKKLQKNKRELNDSFWNRRASITNTRVKRMNLSGEITGEELKNKYQEQEGECCYCGHEIKDVFEVDHKNPLKENGKHEIENIQITCRDCNQLKNKRKPEEFEKFLIEYAKGILEKANKKNR